MQQKQLLRAVVQVKTLWLALRFNCKVSFALKDEFAAVIATTDSTFPLLRGQAHINSSLSALLPSSPHRQLRLAVIMSSANGIVPAGHVDFSLPHNTQVSTSIVLPLQRCQDSRAQVQFTVSLLPSDTLPPTSFTEAYPKIDSSRRKDVALDRKLIERTILEKRSASLISRQSSYSAIKLYRRLGRSLLKGQIYDFRLQNPRGDQVIAESEGQISTEQLLKENQEYWMEIARLQRVNESLKNELQDLQVGMARLQAQGEGSRLQEEKVYALVSELQVSLSTIKQLQDQNSRQRSLLGQQEQLINQLKPAFGEQLQKVRDAQSRLEEQRYISSKQVMLLKQSITQLNNEKDFLSLQLSEANRNLSFKQSQFDALEQESKQNIHTKGQQIKALKEQAESKQHCFESLLGQTRTLKAQLEEVRVIEDNSRLTHSLQEQKFKFSAQNEQCSLREQIDIVKRSKEDLRTNNQSLVCQLGETKKEVLEQELSLTSLTVKLKELQQEKQSASDYRHSHRQSITQLNLQQARLEQSNKELRQQVKAKDDQLQQLEKKWSKQVSDVKVFAKSRLAQILSLRKQKSDLQLRVKSMTFIS